MNLIQIEPYGVAAYLEFYSRFVEACGALTPETAVRIRLGLFFLISTY